MANMLPISGVDRRKTRDSVDKTVKLDRTPTVDKEYEAAVDQFIAEMNRLAEEMAERQRRIDRLQAETQAALQALFTELKIS